MYNNNIHKLINVLSFPNNSAVQNLYYLYDMVFYHIMPLLMVLYNLKYTNCTTEFKFTTKKFVNCHCFLLLKSSTMTSCIIWLIHRSYYYNLFTYKNRELCFTILKYTLNNEDSLIFFNTFEKNRSNDNCKCQSLS